MDDCERLYRDIALLRSDPNPDYDWVFLLALRMADEIERLRVGAEPPMPDEVFERALNPDKEDGPK
jgi:hypothetical protein